MKFPAGPTRRIDFERAKAAAGLAAIAVREPRRQTRYFRRVVLAGPAVVEQRATKTGVIAWLATSGAVEGIDDTKG